ncbi:major facilitator superfamily domain-containing protein [Talaromyces proteolyticus]|uniref:Major facilitator superfamily domain-containing protein n=1 Tax=Talaromyces proteolyticus TaxID=1131652 RepID=A0AAD4KSQ7_9EURO|nr:major facilitator superfamily domain-containing protein [Talaromyces proteolyticus]KAH8700227.1 major facilitator superfamily domain-containing protein [Talaromyces proteolyticus]
MMSDLKDAKSESAVAVSLSGADDTPVPSGSEIYIDPEMEKRVMAKFDRYMLPQITILPFILFLDRSNIGNAKVFGFEQSLGLVGNQYGNINTIFYASYVVFEIPWVVGMKRWGANIVIPISFVCWSLVTLGTGFVQNYGQTIALRVLLGVFESGLFPGLTFLISTIYSREAQGMRVAFIYLAGALSGAFGGLIAYGIQLMGDRLGLEAWRWLFIIEGCVSVVICGIAWFTLPKNAENAWFLTTEEKELMQRRKQRDIIFKGDDEFSWKYIPMAFKDVHIYIAAMCAFCSSIPLFGFATFLPTILVGMGYTSMQANYLTIPVYFWGSILLFAAAWVSDHFKNRALVAFVAPLAVILGYAIALGTSNAGAGYFAMFLCAGGIYVYNTILYTWIANNLKPDYKRSVGIPLFASLSNVSGTISSQIYPSTDAPRYILGNAISLTMEVVAMTGIGIIFLLLRSRNNKKQKLIDEGVTDNGKDGDKALDFKYIL